MSKGGLPLCSHKARRSFLVFSEKGPVFILQAQEGEWIGAPLSTSYLENCDFLFYIELEKKEK